MPAVEKITREELYNHLVSLDTTARHLRFGFSPSNESIDAYTNSIPRGDFLFGIRSDIDDDVVSSAIHLAIDGDVAELGISTLESARRKGYAERLLRYGIDILRNRQIYQMYSVCLPENWPLLKLIQKLNIISIKNDEGDRQANISIPMAGLDSIFSEIQNEQMVIIDRSMKPWASMWSAMLRELKKNGR
jgi:RimJ/RimL family protein N-acetyltransferase